MRRCRQASSALVLSSAQFAQLAAKHRHERIHIVLSIGLLAEMLGDFRLSRRIASVNTQLPAQALDVCGHLSGLLADARQAQDAFFAANAVLVAPALRTIREDLDIKAPSIKGFVCLLFGL